MSYEQILTDSSEGILTITLNRPERLNAWTAQMAGSFAKPSTRPTPTTRCA